MKNPDFNACWDTYVTTLSDVNKRRARPMRQAIEQFESNGFDVSTMTYYESLILVNMLAKTLTYSSLVCYCAVYNHFAKMMETVLDKSFQKLLPSKADNNHQLYASEEQFLLDIEQRLAELSERFKKTRSATDDEVKKYQESRLAAITNLILTFYGLSRDECRYLKMTDIDEKLRTITFLRNDIQITRQLSEDAFEYILKYKHLTGITHYFRQTVHYHMADTGYLFRNSRHTAHETDIVSSDTLTSATYVFCKDSNIKRWIGLSGAFIRYAEQTLDPEGLRDFITDYLGERTCTKMNIKKRWNDFLEIKERADAE